MNVCGFQRLESGFSLIELLVVLGISSITILGGSQILLMGYEQQRRGMASARTTDLISLLRQAVTDQSNVRTGRCSSRISLRDGTFDPDKAMSAQGLPIRINDLPGLGRPLYFDTVNDTQNTYTGFGHITELSFAYAKERGVSLNALRENQATAREQTKLYVGDVYLGIKDKVSDKNARRLYVGTISLNVSLDNQLRGCTTFGGLEEASVCAVLGKNVVYDEKLGRCLAKVGGERVHAGLCPADKRMMVNEFGQVDCVPITTTVHCGYRDNGHARWLHSTIDGTANCNGSKQPDGTYNSGDLYTWVQCGGGQFNMAAFTQCMNHRQLVEGKDYQTAYWACAAIHYDGITSMRYTSGCFPPAIVPGPTPPSEADLVRTPVPEAPQNGKCLCGGIEINPGQHCSICTNKSSYGGHLDGFWPIVWSQAGYTRHTSICNASGVLEVQSKTTNWTACTSYVEIH
jgi:prepilin-type N-terminal cleavage/methylation domain-containing protein